MARYLQSALGAWEAEVRDAQETIKEFVAADHDTELVGGLLMEDLGKMRQDLTTLLKSMESRLAAGIEPDCGTYNQVRDRRNTTFLIGEEDHLRYLKHILLWVDFLELNLFVAIQYNAAMKLAAAAVVGHIDSSLNNTQLTLGTQDLVALCSDILAFVTTKRPGIVAFAQRAALLASKQWTRQRSDQMEALLANVCHHVDWEACASDQLNEYDLVDQRSAFDLGWLQQRLLSSKTIEARMASNLARADWPWRTFRTISPAGDNETDAECFFPIAYDSPQLRIWDGGRPDTDSQDHPDRSNHPLPLAEMHMLADWRKWKSSLNGKRCLTVVD